MLLYKVNTSIEKNTFLIRCCSIILYRCDALYIPSINLNRIKSSSIVCSSCPSFSDSQYLRAFRRRCRYFMIGLSISCFIDMNFVLSDTTNLFVGLIFLLIIWLIFFFKTKVLKVFRIRHGGDFHYRLASSCSQKGIRNLISPHLFSLSPFSFLVLALAAKKSLLRIDKIGILEKQLVSLSATPLLWCERLALVSGLSNLPVILTERLI